MNVKKSFYRTIALFCFLMGTARAQPQPPDPLGTTVARSIIRALKIPNVEASYLLLFDSQIRPGMYTEEALIAFRRSGDKWLMVNVYRHPRDRVPKSKPRPDRDWTVNQALDGPSSQVGEREFDHRPSMLAAIKFVYDTDWSFRPIGHCRFLRIEVYRSNWAAFGDPPTFQFEQSAASGASH